jgi:nucleoside-diphosphate-sugar epimerase
VGQLPWIHVDDAVSATLAALDRAQAGSVYDIVDDRAVSMSELVKALAEYSGAPAPLKVPTWLPRLIAPYMTRLMTTQMPLSNAKAKAELGWTPQYSTIHQGLAEMFPPAA